MRKLAFHLHLYAGLVAGALLLVSGLSGSLIVFSDETDAWLDAPAFRVAPAPGRIPLQTALDKVVRAHPGETPAVLYLGREPGATHRFSLRSKAGLRLVSVNPYDGTVVADRFRARTFVGWTRDLHVQLLSGKNGETVVGVAGILLFLLCLSGLVVWFPKPGRRWSAGLKMKLSGGWKRSNYDLHRAGGFFMLALLTMTSLTGVALVFDDTASRVVSFFTRGPARLTRPAVKPETTSKPLSLDALSELAEAALPGGELGILLFPQKPGDAIGFRKRFDGDWHHAGRSFVYLDPFSGTVLRVDDARAAPAGTRVMNLIYPLHTGEWAGTATRVVQVVVGISPGALFLSGFLMWWNRVVVRRLHAYRRNHIQSETHGY